ncbi:hypothetical protein Tco_0348425 [Tanacetum coccineum]
MHHVIGLNSLFLLVMLRLELHKASVLAVGRLTLGLLPRYTSCFSRTVDNGEKLYVGNSATADIKGEGDVILKMTS